MHKKTIEASKTAAKFLLPPHASKFDRDIAKDVAVNMLREAIPYLVQADQSDLASAVLDLAQRIEATNNV